jgi:tetratricopeptide (TPR) repeat protein
MVPLRPFKEKRTFVTGPTLRRWACVALALGVMAGVGCAGVPLQRRAAELNARGAAQLARGELDAAEASLQVALEYNDRYSEPYNNLGLVALARGHVRAARDFFLRAVRLNPDFGEAWSNLGLARARPAGDGDQGDPQGAIEAFREALSINPALVAPRINLCRTLLSVRDARSALDQARRAVQLHPNHAHAHALRAEAALALSLDDEARESSERAERLAPFAPDILLTRARVLASVGRFEEALSKLSTIQRDPSRGADARALRALIERYAPPSTR